MSHFEYPSTRLILRPPLGEDSVDRYATDQNWSKENETPEDWDAGTPREVTWRVSTEVVLHYAVDDATSYPYIFFTTPRRHIGMGFIQDAQQHLSVFTSDELL